MNERASARSSSAVSMSANALLPRPQEDGVDDEGVRVDDAEPRELLNNRSAAERREVTSVGTQGIGIDVAPEVDVLPAGTLFDLAQRLGEDDLRAFRHDVRHAGRVFVGLAPHWRPAIGDCATLFGCS